MSRLNPFDHSICLTHPLRLMPSGWIGHIPFAMFLIDVLRPKLLVELGTQHGVSYCSFCQAVKELKVDTSCYAIDTWQGDKHAGYYGPEVLAEFKEHHDPLYGDFSRLIQSDFDDALPHFSDKSIDLLHLDGYHTYGAVKHDFEAWLPKLSDKGIVLLHDTRVRDGDFGVWKLWEELILQYPHFEFAHSHGLGLLAVGNQSGDLLPHLMTASEDDQWLTRQGFYQLGNRLELITELQAMKQIAQDKCAEWNTLQAGLQDQISRTQAQIVSLRTAYDDQVAKQQEEMREARLRYETRIAHYENELRRAWRRNKKERHRAARLIEALRAQISGSEDLVRERDDEIVSFRNQLAQANESNLLLSAQLSGKTREVDKMRHSLGWRMLSRYGGFKYRFLLPAYRAFGLPPYGPKVREKNPVGIPSAENLEPVTISSSSEPQVSIIIPVFNQCEFTIACLNSIQEVLQQTQIKVEVIVVDDHSTDQTQEVLTECAGIRTVTNKENLGFIDSCNRGAAIAHGQYLLFLNNDTLVDGRCFDELLGTFQIFPDAGLVGAKLTYPDGSLQEAGGIVWKDGTGWNFGRSDDPDKPEYCYLREVDYCSGACIMVPRELFNELGGFDISYRPAYYEDTDLAFRIRRAGFKVYYQPLAQVTHFEGVTCGTDVTSNVKQYQLVNQQKFRAKWSQVLATHGNSGGDPNLARERNVSKRILVLDACTITPDQDAGSVMVFNHVRILQSLGYKVTFVSDNLVRDEKYTSNLQRIGIECLYWPYISSIKSHLEAFGSYYDFVFIARADIAEKHIDAVKANCRRARIIFHTVDLHFVREQRQAELENNPHLAESALRRKHQELSLAKKFDCTLVVSDYEKHLLLKENPRLNVAVVPLTLEMPGRQGGFADRTDLLFIGGFQHTPNVDAVLYFTKKIYPAIKRQLPNVQLYVVGSRAPAEILELACEGSIAVTGHVPDVAPYFNRCRLSVAPLRYGAGLKGKVITSLSYGLPMVASTIACEGIGIEDGEEVLIADEPLAFAEKVVRLYTDATLWDKLSSSGFEKVNRKYSYAATKSFFNHLFASLEQSKAVGHR
jgi:GT2 family glycosyltransferase